ncbi:alcohol dehydrogenase, zinc-containing [Sporothrix brasiliensis 5110]|uniref:Alcohol dehydrogenase, zinc-containing n=1 Tax=Sporothrix brasiliensis 5110 TaxID=1398154 RepID=A0A0C2JAU4_9PEZI|nr:alcohol dehydrogenase, zinc-containing [Sporothrix brasiliensis 5110]KIH94017.1 alcohol dehydrogenase, zinc-containing [Sporothrix brasiliensis 5110]
MQMDSNTDTVQQWTTLQNGLEHLARATAPMPTPGPDEVLVKIHAVALNYRDTEVCMGLYNHHKAVAAGGPEPLVPCSDMCGTVVAVGPNLEHAHNVGDHVVSLFNHMHRTGHVRASDMSTTLGLPLPGVLQTYRVFPSIGLLPAPAYLSDAEACCLPIASITAWMAINGMRPLGRSGGQGEVVLLQGTGGVSVAGLQIAKASGATAVVTSSSDAKLAIAKSMGADHLINYTTTPRWADAVLECTAGHGADIIFENGGASTLRQSFDAVAFGGIINCIGYLGGKTDKRVSDDNDDDDRTAINVLALRRNMTLRGILNGPRDRFEEMLQFYKETKIRPVVHRVFAFDEGRDAIQYLFRGQHFGKVVIQVSAEATLPPTSE